MGPQKQELYLPRVKPFYATAEGLIRALGCQIELGHFVFDGTEIGSPPGVHAALFPGGILRYDGCRDKYFADSLIHEAIHWAMGPASLESEASLMPLQLALVRRIACDEDRQAALHQFRIYALGDHAEYCEVDGLADAKGSRWIYSEDWQYLTRLARAEGWPLNGRAPRQPPQWGRDGAPKKK